MPVPANKYSFPIHNTTSYVRLRPDSELGRGVPNVINCFIEAKAPRLWIYHLKGGNSGVKSSMKLLTGIDSKV